MIGDEFVDAEITNHDVFVQEFPIKEGLTAELNLWLGQFVVLGTSYTSYVDVMGHVAQPMLVAIIEAYAVNQEDSSGDSDSEPTGVDAPPAEDVHGHLLVG